MRVRRQDPRRQGRRRAALKLAQAKLTAVTRGARPATPDRQAAWVRIGRALAGPLFFGRRGIYTLMGCIGRQAYERDCLSRLRDQHTPNTGRPLPFSILPLPAGGGGAGGEVRRDVFK